MPRVLEFRFSTPDHAPAPVPGATMLLIAPSPIHGVGVVTTTRLPSGTKLRLIAREDWRFVKKPKKGERGLVERFCVRDEDGYHCPKSFSRMSLGWYLNDADEPNLRPQGEFFVTIRVVKAGEELTIDYDDL